MIGHYVREAVNSSSGTVVRKNGHRQAERKMSVNSNKIAAKSRDTGKEQSLFEVAVKIKFLQKRLV